LDEGVECGPLQHKLVPVAFRFASLPSQGAKADGCFSVCRVATVDMLWNLLEDADDRFRYIMMPFAFGIAPPEALSLSIVSSVGCETVFDRIEG
jgi:hypothetical protein